MFFLLYLSLLTFKVTVPSVEYENFLERWWGTMEVSALLWSGIGYLSGSILFAQIFATLFHRNITATSVDHNPGAANAFRYGGKTVGILTLFGDIAKGWLPVFCYYSVLNQADSGWFVLVLVAPVIGHAWPLFTGFQGGGKGVAVTFGVLLGLLPVWQPVVILAGIFIVFRTVVHISPDYVLTAMSYVLATLCCWLFVPTVLASAMSVITIIVLVRLFFSDEPRTKMEVEIGWKH